MPSTRRLTLSIILVPAILLIAAALLLPLFLDKDMILELAAGTLHDKTGATLTVAGESKLFNGLYGGERGIGAHTNIVYCTNTRISLGVPGEGWITTR